LLWINATARNRRRRRTARAVAAAAWGRLMAAATVRSAGFWPAVERRIYGGWTIMWADRPEAELVRTT
jgi:hypothetical protein